MKDFRDKFKRAGGMTTVRGYAKAHVLGFAVLQAALQGTSQKSLEIVRLSVYNKMLGKLRKRYRPFIETYLKKEAEKGIRPRKHSRDIWMLWLEGMEQAPEIVKVCSRSVQECLGDRPIHILTEKNYREYVTFPDFIQDKIERGIISRTHMSDLLRLELLIKYGGTWMDSTIFCSSSKVPEYMLDSDLFVFQDLKPGLDGHSQRISNWMITACTNHPILRLTRALLYEHWRKNDVLEDYFIFHDLFELAIEAYPDEWNEVIPFSNAAPHILLLRLFEPYNDRIWKAVREMTPFHKLTYKFDEEKTQIPGTYYKVLLEGGEESV